MAGKHLGKTANPPAGLAQGRRARHPPLSGTVTPAQWHNATQHFLRTYRIDAATLSRREPAYLQGFLIGFMSGAQGGPFTSLPSQKNANTPLLERMKRVGKFSANCVHFLFRGAIRRKLLKNAPVADDESNTNFLDGLRDGSILLPQSRDKLESGAGLIKAAHYLFLSFIAGGKSIGDYYEQVMNLMGINIRYDKTDRNDTNEKKNSIAKSLHRIKQPISSPKKPSASNSPSHITLIPEASQRFLDHFSATDIKHGLAILLDACCAPPSTNAMKHICANKFLNNLNTIHPPNSQDRFTKTIINPDSDEFKFGFSIGIASYILKKYDIANAIKNLNFTPYTGEDFQKKLLAVILDNLPIRPSSNFQKTSSQLLTKMTPGNSATERDCHLFISFLSGLASGSIGIPAPAKGSNRNSPKNFLLLTLLFSDYTKLPTGSEIIKKYNFIPAWNLNQKQINNYLREIA